MSEDAATGEVSDLPYEQARDELVRIVARIEGGEVSLEESMILWERGERLAAHCQATLDQAQERLDRSTGTAVDAEEPSERPASAGGSTR